MDKGNKPSRFNEDVETTSVNSLRMSEYLDQNMRVDPNNNQKIKVNLRSINTPAEREQYRKL